MEFKTNKRKLTDDDMLLGISKLDVGNDILRYLSYRKITTVGELLHYDIDLLKDNLGKPLFLKLNNALRKKGFLFKQDQDLFAAFGITEELALVEIDSIDSLSARVKNALQFNGICYIGDLLTTDYAIISKTRNLGSASLKEVRDFVHSMGYELLNEIYPIDEAREKFGTLVGDTLGLSDEFSKGLYNRGIYTLDDLMAREDEIPSLRGLSKDEKKYLLQRIDLVKENRSDDLNLSVGLEIVRKEAELLKKLESFDLDKRAEFLDFFLSSLEDSMSDDSSKKVNKQ